MTGDGETRLAEPDRIRQCLPCIYGNGTCCNVPDVLYLK